MSVPRVLSTIIFSMLLLWEIRYGVFLAQCKHSPFCRRISMMLFIRFLRILRLFFYGAFTFPPNRAGRFDVFSLRSWFRLFTFPSESLFLCFSKLSYVLAILLVLFPFFFPRPPPLISSCKLRKSATNMKKVIEKSPKNLLYLVRKEECNE